MKKNNLFKVVGVVILSYVLLTWLVPIIASIFGSTEELSYQIGFTNLGLALIETFSGFGNIIAYVLLVGGLYGVLEATGLYEKSLEKLLNINKKTLVKILIGEAAVALVFAVLNVTSVLDLSWVGFAVVALLFMLPLVALIELKNKKVPLIVIMVLMAVLSSITGADLGLLIIFPFVISLILMMGYDKLVALAATFGATVIGMYGATFAGTLYGVNSSFLGTELGTELLTKIILFVLGLALLIGFVLLYIKKDMKKNDRKNSDLDDKDSLKMEVKSENSKHNKNLVWPIYLVVGLLLLITLLGTTMWEGIFETNWFSTAHDAMTGWTIGEFAPYDKVFGGVTALGTWNTPTRFQYYSLMIVFAMAILTIFYRIKLSDSFNAFAKGVKEYIVPAILILLACGTFVLTYYYPVLSYLTGLIDGLSNSFNVALTGLHALISSVFYSDFYYYSYYVIYDFASNLEDTSVIPIVDIIFTNIYGLVTLIAPTSLLLLTSLSITEVSYKTWIKFIWKLFLSLLVVSFVVFVIVALI